MVLQAGGSQFVEMYVGVGAKRVREMFEQAKKSAPCVVFIDEIDAVGRRRGGSQYSNEEREQTLNQILVEMDGFEEGTCVVVMAATNRPDVLDQALLRPGRFDRQISTSLPDVKGRRDILEIHARHKPLSDGIDMDDLARETSGMSGADLENLLNEAALLAAKENRTSIEKEDLDEAMERVTVGLAHKNRPMQPEERRMVAIHEAGHALVAHLLPELEPVRKISIVARGAAGGYTKLMGDAGRHLLTETHLRARIAFALGEMAAEEVANGVRSTGAASDFRRANEVAKAMVYQYGMSVELGPVVIDAEFQQPVSPDLLDRAERETRRILGEETLRARHLIESHRQGLDRLVAALLEADSLEGELLGQLLGAIPPLRQAAA